MDVGLVVILVGCMFVVFRFLWCVLCITMCGCWVLVLFGGCGWFVGWACGVMFCFVIGGLCFEFDLLLCLCLMFELVVLDLGLELVVYFGWFVCCLGGVV